MIKRIIVSLGLVLTISAFALSPSAGAIWGGNACSNTSADICQKKDNTDTSSLAEGIINIILYISGLISIIMIIVAGIMYVTAHGYSEKVANAKRTLIYAVVGLVVSVLAVAIVSFAYDTVLTNNIPSQQTALIEQNNIGDRL